MIRRNWRAIFILLSIMIDAAGMAVSAGLAIYFRQFIPAAPLVQNIVFLQFTIFFGGVFMLVGTFFGLYRASFHTDYQHHYFLAAKTYVYSTLLIFSSLYVLQASFPRRFTILFFVFVPMVFALGRILLSFLNRKFQARGFGIHNTLIVLNGGGWAEALERIHLFPELGYLVRGLIDVRKSKSKAKAAAGQTLPNLPVFDMEDLETVIRREQIDRIFIPSIQFVDKDSDALVRICENTRIKLKVLSKESEDLLRFSYIRDIAGITLYAPVRIKTEFVKRAIKRMFDILVSSIALILLLPVFTVIAALILIEDGWPIIFSQKRALARGNREFFFFKFRSMVKDAEARQRELYSKNLVSGGLFKMDDDPRLTRVGRIIRKYSLDELPQFFNVLIGDMSIVGPRPLSLADLENITPENKLAGYYRLRARTKPGITGLWQISGRREIGFREMVLLDLYYIENQSLLLDIEIIAATIPVVLFGKGGY